MRSYAVVEVLIVGQCGLRLTDIELAAILAPELDPGAVVGPLHDPVQLGAFRGQDEQRDAESLAGVFELGAEFAAAVDLDRLERVRQVLDDGLQEPLRIAGGSPRVHPCRHELAGRAGCSELLERPAVSTDRHVVDLHHLAESGLPAAPGPALRMASAEVPSLAGLDVSAAEPAGLDPVEVHQLLQDAPDGGFRPVPAVTLQHDLESPLAEEGVLLAHPAHGRLVGGRPAGGRDAMRAPAFRLQSPHAPPPIALSPPVVSGPGPADHGQGGGRAAAFCPELLVALELPEAFSGLLRQAFSDFPAAV